jgi:hypothetical protein
LKKLNKKDDINSRVPSAESAASRYLPAQHMRLLCGLLLVASSLPIAAMAHHSHGEFSGATEEIDGKLLELVWRNPHPAMTLLAVDENGGERVWRIQVQGNVNGLSRDGVTGDEFVIGERLSVAGRLSSRRPALLLAVRARLADGSDLVLGPDESSGSALYTSNLVGIDPVDAGVVTDIFRVWTVADRVRTQDLPLNNVARAAKAAWDPLLDDPQRGCRPLGMPGAMMSPHPIEIAQVADNIVLRLEEWGAVRTIHMGAGVPLPPPPASRHGYSVGRWDGTTLVITTTRIDYPYLDEHGTPQTDAVEVVERFTPGEAGRSLLWSATVSDPGTMTEPVVAFTTRWDWIPGEKIQHYDCEELDPLE